MGETAAVRYNNPGAQWDGPIAKKWGSKQHVVLADGQANHIAIFPTKVQGACAEFDLWRSRYTGLSLIAAINKWCGGNSPAAYINFLEKNSGVNRNMMVTAQLLASEMGLRLMKAQAQWEAGKPYPMTDAEWRQAQNAVFKGANLPVAPKPIAPPVVAAGSTGAGTVIAAQQASAAGYNWGAVIGILVVGIVIAVVLYLIIHSNQKEEGMVRPLPIPDPTPVPVQTRGSIRATPGGVMEVGQ